MEVEGSLGHPVLGTSQPVGTTQGRATLLLYAPGGVEGGHISG